MTSPDGINWTVRTAAVANSWESVTYGNGLFVAMSADGTNRAMTSGHPEQTIASNNNNYQGGLTVYGNAAFKSDVNSATAFQIQNANGSSAIFGIDSTTSNLVMNPSLEVDTTGWATVGSGTGLAISRTTTTANVYHGTAALQIVTANGTANSGASVTGFSSTITPGTYTLSFMAPGYRRFQHL
ncbi:MAG: hypothetical protein WDN27_03855 [Candidatus Saccharibacteria bacterium]